ncbi:MAG: alpha-galactosidase [Treponema sp.]|jgi:alpha-galactosidase|nr:alpha-galactosidase [Treponema sp.]
MKTYTAHLNYEAVENSVIDKINVSDFVDIIQYPMEKAWINVGGWQSWNPGYEVPPGKKQPSLTCRAIKGWNQYLVFPNTNFKADKDMVLGQFVTYLRWDDFYLVFASVGNIARTLPPVQFVFDRKNNSVFIEICDKGNYWRRDDITAQIEIFTAYSFFECRDKLREIFGFLHLSKVDWLGRNPGGWESWYNHYADINENLIEQDLNNLTKTENIISAGSLNGTCTSKIFQIDDGWEQALGDWDVRSDRFPNGLVPLVEKINAADYIPGLWIAPFIIDARSKTATEHPDWLLRDQRRELVVAGYNPLWGKKGNFYCLDLSNDNVIEHLDKLMEKLINEWGFRYIKLDFLYAGMLYGDYYNKTASYKVYNRAIQILTKRNTNNRGQAVAYLGCGLVFELSFKNMPLSRIGCDTYEHWKNPLARALNWNGRNEAYLNLKDTLGHALWNRTIFANDPDVFFLRTQNCSLTEKEKLLIAKVNSLFGTQFMYSDDPGREGVEERRLQQQILEFRKKYAYEEFGLRQTGPDYYEIFTKKENIKGYIDLSKRREFLLNE